MVNTCDLLWSIKLLDWYSLSFIWKSLFELKSKSLFGLRIKFCPAHLSLQINFPYKISWVIIYSLYHVEIHEKIGTQYILVLLNVVIYQVDITLVIFLVLLKNLALLFSLYSALWSLFRPSVFGFTVQFAFNTRRKQIKSILFCVF